MVSNKFYKKIKYGLRFLPDKIYIQLYYFANFKKFCNLKNPTTYNEKLNWLKLKDRRPEYTQLVDKYEVKKIVSSKIGEEFVAKTYGVWDDFDEINFDKLPNKFVLKCTHDSEGVIIVKDKYNLDINKAKEILTKSLNQNFYYIGREWPYKNVKPRILAEEYLIDDKNKGLLDYKFFCFDGKPKVMFIASDRETGHTKFDYYDLDFNHLDIIQHYPNSEKEITKPKTFKQMIEIAEILSKNMPHVRVDFYEVNGKLYFGELTFYHFGGFMPFQPNRWDMIFGKWLNIEGLKN